MQFLTSSETLEFLSQAAPRPWLCRMLSWMIVEGELDAYFSKAHIQASSYVFHFTIPFREEAGEVSGKKMDTIIDREFQESFAQKLRGKDGMEVVLDDPVNWEAEDGPTVFDPGYFMFASEIDWERGSLKLDWLPEGRDLRQIFFPTDEFLHSEFEDPDFIALLEGMTFEKARIEMMLPNAGMGNLKQGGSQISGMARHVGRPRKWDWEAALTFVVSQAQTPDGLPTGHGAQAKIETMMAEWFERETGKSPSPS